MSKFESHRLFVLNDPHTPRLSPELAVEIGLNESILFLQVEFWIATKGVEKEGCRWIPKSVRDLQEQFPFWSVATINRAVQSLLSSGLLLNENFNQARYDKTRWFAINLEAAKSLKSIAVVERETGGHDTRSTQNETGSAQNETRSTQNETTIHRDCIENKKEEKKEGVKSCPASSTTIEDVSDDEFLASLKADPAYAGLDIDVEVGKLRVWCAERNKTPSRRLFHKWLDKADKPLTLVGKSPPRPTSRRAELKVSGNGIDDLMRSQGAVGRAQ